MVFEKGVPNSDFSGNLKLWWSQDRKPVVTGSSPIFFSYFRTMVPYPLFSLQIFFFFFFFFLFFSSNFFFFFFIFSTFARYFLYIACNNYKAPGTLKVLQSHEEGREIIFS